MKDEFGAMVVGLAAGGTASCTAAIAVNDDGGGGGGSDGGDGTRGTNGAFFDIVGLDVRDDSAFSSAMTFSAVSPGDAAPKADGDCALSLRKNEARGRITGPVID